MSVIHSNDPQAINPNFEQVAQRPQAAKPWYQWICDLFSCLICWRKKAIDETGSKQYEKIDEQFKKKLQQNVLNYRTAYKRDGIDGVTRTIDEALEKRYSISAIRVDLNRFLELLPDQTRRVVSQQIEDHFKTIIAPKVAGLGQEMDKCFKKVQPLNVETESVKQLCAICVLKRRPNVENDEIRERIEAYKKYRIENTPDGTYEDQDKILNEIAMFETMLARLVEQKVIRNQNELEQFCREIGEAFFLTSDIFGGISEQDLREGLAYLSRPDGNPPRNFIRIGDRFNQFQVRQLPQQSWRAALLPRGADQCWERRAVWASCAAKLLEREIEQMVVGKDPAHPYVMNEKMNGFLALPKETWAENDFSAQVTPQFMKDMHRYEYLILQDAGGDAIQYPGTTDSQQGRLNARRPLLEHLQRLATRQGGFDQALFYVLQEAISQNLPIHGIQHWIRHDIKRRVGAGADSLILRNPTCECQSLQKINDNLFTVAFDYRLRTQNPFDFTEKNHFFRVTFAIQRNADGQWQFSPPEWIQRRDVSERLIDVYRPTPLQPPQGNKSVNQVLRLLREQEVQEKLGEDEEDDGYYNPSLGKWVSSEKSGSNNGVRIESSTTAE
jgi:hypothetical protein